MAMAMKASCVRYTMNVLEGHAEIDATILALQTGRQELRAEGALQVFEVRLGEDVHVFALNNRLLFIAKVLEYHGSLALSASRTASGVDGEIMVEVLPLRHPLVHASLYRLSDLPWEIKTQSIFAYMQFEGPQTVELRSQVIARVQVDYLQDLYQRFYLACPEAFAKITQLICACMERDVTKATPVAEKLLVEHGRILCRAATLRFLLPLLPRMEHRIAALQRYISLLPVAAAPDSALFEGIDIDEHGHPSPFYTADTLLQTAARVGHLLAVKECLARKANVAIKNRETGGTSLHAAAAGGHDSIFFLLLQQGAPPLEDVNDYAEKPWAGLKGPPGLTLLGA